MADDGWNDDGWNDTPATTSYTRNFTNSRGNWRPRGRGFQRNTDTNWRSNDERRPPTSNNEWFNNSNKNGAPQQKEVLIVPSEKVGRIIGKGGSKIRDLEFESQAKIKIDKNNDDGQEMEVVLFGSVESINKAKSMIQNLMKDRPPPSSTAYTSSKSTDSKEYVKLNDEGVEVIDWDRLNSVYKEGQEEKWAKLPPIIKDFYREHPEVTAMTPTEVAKWRDENNNIQVRRTFENKPGNKNIPNPVLTFEHAFQDHPEILAEIYKQNFEKPSPIQSQAWPILLSGEDMIGIAQTGTGKTLAFLLPALIHIEGQTTPREERLGPTCLILAPTRELALQIDKEVSKYHYRDIKSVCIYGGADRRQQINLVTKGVDIVIATPGRFNDLILAGHLKAIAFSYIVLDEADRMLDMGFEPQIRKSLFDVRPDRQTVMTSATWPSGVRRLAETYMKDPIQVNVGSLDLAAVHSVSQQILFVEEEDKESLLFDFILQMEPTDKIIVFCGKKATANHVSTELCLKGINCQSLHGDRDQSDRELALEEMIDGTVNILIATDVASRGLDICDITHVINFDFPKQLEEYVHRVGRTGRAGKTGTSISFMTRKDWANARELIGILEEAGQDIPDELEDMANRFEQMKLRREEGGGGRGRGGGRGGGGRGGFRRDRW